MCAPTCSLTQNIQKMMSGVFFFLLSIFVVLLGTSLLAFDQGVHDISYDIMVGVHGLVSQTILTYVASRFAEQLISQSFSIGDIVYDAPWYTFPTKFQKNFVLIIQKSNVPFHLRGFWIFNVSMATFSDVSISYFSLALILNCIMIHNDS